MNSLSRLAPSVVPLALPWVFLACSVPVDDSKYQVVETPPPPDDPDDRVVSAFASGSDSCEMCLRKSCTHAIEPCVDTPACAEFSECVQNEGNPAAQARCSSQEENVTLETVAAFGGVRTCWAVSCKAACDVGKNWSCLGRYDETQPPRSSAFVRQSFTNLCNGQAVRDAAVQYCDPFSNCEPRVFTDASGSYTFEVPTPGSGALVGWRGYRWVGGGGLGLYYRLQRNLPILSDLVESTSLVALDCADNYTHELGSTDDSEDPIDWMKTMAVQIFDCQTTGADGAVLKVTTAPDAKIRYAVTLGAEVLYERDESKASGEGLALVANLPEGEHEFAAYESVSGEFIGAGSAYIGAGVLNIFSIFPEVRSMPSPPTK